MLKPRLKDMFVLGLCLDMRLYLDKQEPKCNFSLFFFHLIKDKRLVKDNAMIECLYYCQFFFYLSHKLYKCFQFEFLR